MSIITCKLPPALSGRLSALAKRRGVTKSTLVREALENRIAAEESAGASPANLAEALGSGIGAIASGKGDLARNKKRLTGYGR